MSSTTNIPVQVEDFTADEALAHLQAEGISFRFGPVKTFKTKKQDKYAKPVTPTGSGDDNKKLLRSEIKLTPGQFRDLGHMTFEQVCNNEDEQFKVAMELSYNQMIRSQKDPAHNESLRDAQRSAQDAIVTYMKRTFKTIRAYLRFKPDATADELLLVFEQFKYISYEWAVASGKAFLEFLLSYSLLGHLRNLLVSRYLQPWPWAVELFTTHTKSIILSTETELLIEATKEGIHSNFRDPATGFKVNDTAAVQRLGISEQEIRKFASKTYNMSGPFNPVKMAQAWTIMSGAQKFANELAAGNIADGTINMVILDEAHKFPDPGEEPDCNKQCWSRIYNQNRTAFAVLLTATTRGWVQDGFKSIHQEDTHVNVHCVSRVTYGTNLNMKLVTKPVYIELKTSIPMEVSLYQSDGTKTDTIVDLSSPITSVEAHGARHSPEVWKIHLVQALQLQKHLQELTGEHAKILAFTPGYCTMPDDTSRGATSTAPVATVPDAKVDKYPKIMCEITEKLINDNEEHFTSPVTGVKFKPAYVSSGSDQTPSERKQILADFKQGGYDILFNRFICSSGFSEETIVIVLNFDSFNPSDPSSINRFIQSLIGRGCRVMNMNDSRITRIASGDPNIVFHSDKLKTRPRPNWLGAMAANIANNQRDCLPQKHYILDASYSQGHNSAILDLFVESEGADSSMIGTPSNEIFQILSESNPVIRNAVAQAESQRAARQQAGSSTNPVAVAAPQKSKAERDAEFAMKQREARLAREKRVADDKEAAALQAKAVSARADFGKFQDGLTTIVPTVTDGVKQIKFMHTEIVPVSELIQTKYSIYAVFVADTDDVFSIDDSKWYMLPSTTMRSNRSNVTLMADCLDIDFNYIKLRATNTLMNASATDGSNHVETDIVMIPNNINEQFTELLAPKKARKKPTVHAAPAQSSGPESDIDLFGDDIMDDGEARASPDVQAAAHVSTAELALPPWSLVAVSKPVLSPAQTLSTGTGDAAEDELPEPVFGYSDAGTRQSATRGPYLYSSSMRSSGGTIELHCNGARKRKPADDRPLELVDGPRNAKKAAMSRIESYSPRPTPADKNNSSESDEDDDDDDDDDGSEDFIDEDESDDPEEYMEEEVDDDDVDDVHSDVHSDDSADEDYEDGKEKKNASDGPDAAGSDSDADDGTAKPKRTKPRKTALRAVVKKIYGSDIGNVIKNGGEPSAGDTPLEKSVTTVPVIASVHEVVSSQAKMAVIDKGEVNKYDTSKNPKLPDHIKISNHRSAPVPQAPVKSKKVKTAAMVDNYLPHFTASLDKFQRVLVDNAVNSSLSHSKTAEFIKFATKHARDLCTRITMGVTSIISDLLDSGMQVTMSFDDMLKMPDTDLTNILLKYHPRAADGSFGVGSDIRRAFDKYSNVMWTA